MNQHNRLEGGLIDRSQSLSFSFNGKEYSGYQGDTLASALLANDVRLVGRSFKYHRPRGVFTADSSEPNALVELRSGAHQEPNTRATVAELFDGLEAHPQNCRPSLSFDMLAINDKFSKFLSAGFYYKTFMWPAKFWLKVYEPFIRRSAGLGSLSFKNDPDAYDKGFKHCDTLVIGSGPAGLMAALTAAQAGSDVILAEEDFVFGGRLNNQSQEVADMSASEWVKQTVATLAAMPNVRLMSRTSVFGAYDQGVYGAVERVTDHLSVAPSGKPRQILWRIYSQHVILCAGATERPIGFNNNERPGIMLASALRAYVNRYAVTPAKKVAIFTNNDGGHQTALDLHRKGVTVSAVIDTREDAPGNNAFKVLKGAQIMDTSGRLGLKAVEVSLANGATEHIECGALGVSGGWSPNVHLTCHLGSRPHWDESILGFVAKENAVPGMEIADPKKGLFTTYGALSAGRDAAVKALGITGATPSIPHADDTPFKQKSFWYTKNANRAWIDQQNDVTYKDVVQSHLEGFRSVEHLKRYTTLGMATDQGKTSNILGLAVMAAVSNKTMDEVGTTVFRAPYTPVSLGALGGRSTGKAFRPTRFTPSHYWAVERGAEFIEVGNWLRARWFPLPGDANWRQTVDREVSKTRSSVGICDCTTLGKIDVQGVDSAAFLNTVYCNGFAKLAVGKVRYGLMLREDGIAMDDGTAARLAEDHFVVTTTTANAAKVYQHMEFVRQCLLPHMDVSLISTTEAWAQYAVAGPNSRKLLQKVVDPEYDISNEAFPYMGCGNITICGGLRARLFRISFSGELAFELAVPARYGDALMRTLLKEGEEFDAIPYGSEALGVMRIEKGHAAGNELNGTISALNLNMGKMVSDKKDSIGAVLAKREGMNQDDALRMVGIKAVNPEDVIIAGGHLMNIDGPVDAAHDQGYVTSLAFSPTLSCYVALAFLKKGHERLGEKMRFVSPLTKHQVDVEIVSPHFVDPKGERLHV